MVALKWEEPVSTSGAGARVDWVAVAEALKRRPGEWAVVAENVSSGIASRIRSGQMKAFRRGAYQAKARGVNQANGRSEKIYARYVGEEEGVL